MNTFKITSMGRKQFQAIDDYGNVHNVDMDGYILVSNQDYMTLAEKGYVDTTSIIAPMHNEGDEIWEMVAEWILLRGLPPSRTACSIIKNYKE